MNEENTDNQSTIEDTMSAAYDRAQGLEDSDTSLEETDQGTDVEVEETAEVVEEEVEQEEIEDNAPEVEDEASEEEDMGDDEESPDDLQEEDSEDEGLTPPDRWSSEDKEEFNALSAEAQKLVLKREKDVEKYLTQKSQQVAEARKYYESLETILQPRREGLQTNGLSDAQAIADLFKYSDYAANDPVGFIKFFAKQRGIDLMDMETNYDDEDWGDGSTNTPAPVDQQTQTRLAQLEAQIAQQQQARDSELKNEVQNQIEQFSSNKEYKYFEEVRETMGQLIGSNIAKDLPDAYEKAIRMNDKVWEKASSEKRIKTNQSDVAKAKRAAKSNVKASATNSVEGETKLTMEETMSKAYDRAMKG